MIGANLAGVRNRLRPLADDLESWSHGEPVAVSPASRTQQVIPESYTLSIANIILYAYECLPRRPGGLPWPNRTLPARRQRPKDESTLPPATPFGRGRTGAWSPGSEAFGIDESKPVNRNLSLSLSPGSTFGRYRIVRTLGEGGMGSVYLAHDSSLDRPVALKVPKFTGNSEVAAARFLREARSAASLQHPNICPIYDLGENDGIHFFSMAFIAGESLGRGGLPRTGSWNPRRPERMIRQIALAMQFAHDRGIVHRDLKPANVMIDRQGEPIVMDFGLVRSNQPDARELTAQGDVMGTPAYMPPEQIGGDLTRIGPASDIYSLGALLYELLTGQTPFRGDAFSLLSQAVADAPPPPSSRRPGLASQFDSICLKALAKNPAERWKSMRAFADVLAGLCGVADADSIGLALKGAKGTGIAYRPPSTLPVVCVGRQKRKVGDPPEAGNDFVIRVAGNGMRFRLESAAAISSYTARPARLVADRSKAGLIHNGSRLIKDELPPIADGDELVVAGLVTLDVLLRRALPDERVQQAAYIEIPANSDASGRVRIEASVGDMVTID